MNGKLKMLSEMYRQHGDFYLWLQGWPRHILYSQTTSRDRLEAKHRSIFHDEIILDLEDRRELLKLIERLMKDGHGFKVWATGSRGYHLQLIFPELLYYKEEHRKQIRKEFIKKYGCDLQKMTGLIALENEEHWKGTGKRKTLASVHNLMQNNQLPEDVLKCAEKAVYTAEEWKGAKPSEISNDWLKTDPVIDFCLNHTIPDGTGRYGTVVKNLGIAMGLCGASDAELKPIVDKIISNMSGRKASDFWGWIKSAKSGRYKSYNRLELAKWFEKNEVVLNGE